MSAGLRQVLADTPVRSGSLELKGGWTEPLGLYARGELGARLTSRSSAFAYAEASQRGGAGLGLGYRWEFDF